MKGDLRQYVFASSAAAVVGIWNVGAQVQRESASTAGWWQLDALESSTELLETGLGPLVSLVLGASFALPLLLTTIVVSRLWAEVFSRVRGRALDPGWFLSAWLFTLLLPATMPLHYAAIGFSFGAVFGSHVFGGSGRYIVNPALLGVAFLAIAYPGLFAENRLLPGSDVVSTWALVNELGIEAGGASWLTHFLGREVSALGTSSALASLLGAGYLVARKIVPAGIVGGAIIGLFAASELIGALPGLWHLALGNFAFALAFIATDQATSPSSRIGGWAFGLLFGLLTVVLRMADPDHPEGTVSALLLASLCIPLLDYVARSAAQSARTSGVTDRD